MPQAPGAARAAPLRPPTARVAASRASRHLRLPRPKGAAAVRRACLRSGTWAAATRAARPCTSPVDGARQRRAARACGKTVGADERAPPPRHRRRGRAPPTSDEPVGYYSSRPRWPPACCTERGAGTLVTRCPRLGTLLVAPRLWPPRCRCRASACRHLLPCDGRRKIAEAAALSTQRATPRTAGRASRAHPAPALARHPRRGDETCIDRCCACARCKQGA